MATVKRTGDPGVLKRIKLMGKKLNGTELKVGWFETARYEDGTPVAYVAAIHEFGSPRAGIPPRPFMRPTIEREESNWRDFITQESRKIVAGVQTPENAFEVLGLNVAGEIARSIADVQAPPLKAATIAAKKRKMADIYTTGSIDKPLVETGILITSVSHTVEKT